MPASFARLRIAGFKSFAEPVSVEILPGLTGIVGPNGCGKSNVVEALRWAMGESSAKSLRGADMDDVIFAGTAHRAARNLADVTIVLEDTRSVAPPPFHEAEALEISRRIERGGGSVYRVNGREARARDVQTLFADLASGARASAMVSQGRVGALVSARPDERRALLEEAAGITGLHARRHEAELKLRAAEANLARAEDLRGQLDGQLDGLRRQARQAARYRTISAAIRGAEAELLSLQRARAAAVKQAAEQALAASGAAVAEATIRATEHAARATEAAALLPALREAEAVARTALERHRLAGEQIEGEIARARAALAEAQTRARQLDTDLAHATRHCAEAEAAVARLAEEQTRLEAEQAAHPPLAAAARDAALLAAEAVRGADQEMHRATEHAAELAARHRAAAEALAAAEPRARRLREQHAKLREELERLSAGMIPPERLTAAAAARDVAAGAAAAAARALAEAEAARTAAFTQAAALREAGQMRAATLRTESRAAAERARGEAAAAVAAARATAGAAETARARLAAERQALAEVLGVRDHEKWPRMVDQLVVPAGLEAALGAALGEELDSAADTAAARHWRDLPPLDPPPALPEGARALSALVQAPPALARALSQIGLVTDGARASELAPGQMLVSAEGAVWRWDGYTIRQGTLTAAAVRLQQRNRLAGLAAQLAAAQDAAQQALAALRGAEAAEKQARGAAESLEQAQRRAAEQTEAEARAAAKQAEDDAAVAERAARGTRDAADRALAQARAELARLETQSAAASARAAGLAEQDQRLAAELSEAEAALAQARAVAAALPDLAEARAALEAARGALAAARARERATAEADDALGRAEAARVRRLGLIGADRADRVARVREARDRVTDLTARAREAAAARDALLAAPDALAAAARAAAETLDGAEAQHRAAAGRLAQVEAASEQAGRAARAAEAALSAAREAAARSEGEAAQARHAWGIVAERILERLGAQPALPDPPDDVSEAAEEKHRRRHERMLREREEMGPVNLRAEIEAQAIEAQIESIAREREELATAIAKLRGSIGHLNREGRERLTAVFAAVDQHFQALFARMFGGGRAHLALVGSDDPLAAGLEIYAQPPGKKLAALSLLSGGEQALTALSLIFAVFRCNPAPICVLDEVDAPLDDANVDRFCTLLEDMVRDTGTRFLVVTHHAHTMARMDRLYGVTMQERGVSRLLSVDLQKATAMVDAIAAE